MSATKTERPTPRGVLAIVTDSGGEVIATADDFNPSGMGGCKLYEAQGYRVEQRVKWEAVRAYCSPVIAKVLTAYLLEQIFTELQGKGSHRLQCRAIGYEPEAQEYFDRRHGSRRAG